MQTWVKWLLYVNYFDGEIKIDNNKLEIDLFLCTLKSGDGDIFVK